MKKISIVFIFLILTFAIVVFYFYTSVLKESIKFPKDEIIEVPSGASTTKIISIFNGYDALEPSWIFKFYLRILARNENKFIKAGYYKFDSTMTNQTLVDALMSGSHQHSLKITIPEGLTYIEIAEIIEKRTKIPKKRFIALCENDSLLKARKIAAMNVEGYLLPNTYNFPPSANERIIIDRLLNELETLWKKQIANKIGNVSLNKHEILTLASIVEAETPIDAEKAKVSGLYHNRLKKKMLLQADPTVQYGMGQKKRLLYADLEHNTKYNTYKFSGLPPGPINNPGAKAILAAVEPESHTYLYMVATPDHTGWHNFSDTYSEHLVFVNQYRKWFKNRNR
ncbi:MAG: endolytic transglycosylase MltG [Desulfobulbaceae bacterium]|nr:endolytic transglycosylase MltG [Candidatus Kapabacteria bacterium]MBS4001463.1 endolytic transglycosylase MltG [Desulfobulbaceae bacterium]